MKIVNMWGGVFLELKYFVVVVFFFFIFTTDYFYPFTRCLCWGFVTERQRQRRWRWRWRWRRRQQELILLQRRGIILLFLPLYNRGDLPLASLLSSIERRYVSSSPYMHLETQTDKKSVCVWYFTAFLQVSNPKRKRNGTDLFDIMRVVY